MKISIVMAAYKRSHQLDCTLNSIFQQTLKPKEIIVVEDGDDGRTKSLCESWNVTYLQRKNRPDVKFSCPSVLLNMGIFHATGDIIIIQNPECKYLTQNDISNMSLLLEEKTAVLAQVFALKEDGSQDQWYAHPVLRPAEYFFCGMIHRKELTDIGGFDEDYTLYGYEDDDLRDRLIRRGIKFKWATGVTLHHQWHPRIVSDLGDPSITNEALYHKKTAQLISGEIGVIRNGRVWDTSTSPTVLSK